jgi:hypothetical protein
MTSPLTSAATSYVSNSGTTNIDALLSGYKWGGSAGSGAILSYSFPWINGSSSVFSGPNGQGSVNIESQLLFVAGADGSYVS